MGKQPPKWLPGDRVKETILLQRKSVEQLRADRVLRKDQLKHQRERRKSKIDQKRKRKLSTKKFISAQTILKHAQRKEHQGHTFRKIGEKVEGKQRRSKPENLAKYLKNSKVALIIRAKGTQIPPEVAAAFKELGLQKLYAGRLIVMGRPRTQKLLKQLKPFSIVGQPDAKQLEALLRTRGALYNEETQSRRFISGNMLLEQALGQYNVLCIEDLVDTVANRTEHVDEVLKRIAPFDFHPPRQLFMERHRSVHEKLEKVNAKSFAAYLADELQHTEKRERKQARKTKESAASAASGAPAAKRARAEK